MQALNYIHNRNIVHRDIKPENIMIDKQSDTVKIIDFGTSVDKDKNRVSGLIGSILYMAPEVISKSTNLKLSIKSKCYDEQVDSWSVGAILYLVCCGKPPFYSADDVELAKMIVNDPVDFNDSIWQVYSTDLKELVMALLEKDP